ncbi:zinc metalloprotease HtpX [Thermodesulfobacterium sp.]|jgi:heat shock protein HtpX|uniref:Protease HtpX homolog n=1 Tax=Thermodesulfobacterium commune TaxID=1741 RepID=A0A3B8NBV9_9BACT|nr:zinc metalloprotease HtpX [Thermodesulfobacterium sp.]MBZ4681451.1 protease HtpX [Thermodesulfobacterium sp.]MDK2862146.1 heat shock protein HtpX [Thermodesulfobacterium sp.]MDN5380169.1 heat shock protein HtpX [Thermodesulfobacterium sp.]HAA84164.1 protease HtpX [Thermodesulfobacterium commune]
MSNVFRTFLFLAILTVLFIFVGKLIGGKTGMTIALIMAGLMNFIAYFFSDKIVLATSGAIPVEKHEDPELHAMVEEVARRAGIPKPKVYVIPVETPNAFATGRNPENGVVAVTAGIRKLLTPEELKGVIAHEIAHIKNRDILISTIAAVLVGAITYLANIAQWRMMFGGFSRDEEENNNPLAIVATLVAIIVIPIAATLIQLAISRSREFLADETGAKIIKNPLALARALEKLENWNRAYPMDINPAKAQMFIVNPLSGKTLFKLLSTHPPIEERVARLIQLAKEIR